MLPDLHTGFSGGRSGGLVFPSIEEFSTVYCDPHSQFGLLGISKFRTGFPGGSAIKNLPANAGDTGLIPGLGRSPGEENGNPLQYSCLGNPTNRGTWWATVCGVAKELDMTQQLNNINTNLGGRSINLLVVILNLLLPPKEVE